MHKRFAHPSYRVLRKCRTTCKGFTDSIPHETNSICRGCTKGRMTAKSYPRTSKIASDILELVHMDVIEQPTLSYNNKKYCLTIIDDHSSIGWVYPIAKKSDAFTQIKYWH